MTINDLILDCLKLGLDGEKVDYSWKKDGDTTVIIEFEDGKRARVSIEETN
jgi:hypothetical protein